MIAPAINGYEDIIAYGSSMGAYAALKYSEILRANICIVISPQTFAGRSYAAKDGRWAKDWLQFDGGRISLNSNKTIYYIIYDSKEPNDSMHVDELSFEDLNVGNLKKIKIPYSGHPSGVVLNESGALKPMIHAFVERRELGEIEVNKIRKISPTYMFNLALKMKSVHRSTAVKLMQRATLAAPLNAKFRRILSGYMYAGKSLAQALENAIIAHLVEVENNEYAMHLAHMLIVNKNKKLALSILKKYPDSDKKKSLLKKIA